MNQTLACAVCGRPLHVPDDLRGQEVKCPACHHTFLAPEAELETIPHAEVASVPTDENAPRRRPILHGGPDRDDERARRTDEYVADFQDAPHHYSDEKPPKVMAIAIMTLVGGILAILFGVAFAASCFLLLWPGTYYSFVLGVMAIIQAATLFGYQAYRQQPPRTIAIMQIINIFNGDVVNLTLGIVTLVFLSDPEVEAYFRG